MQLLVFDSVTPASHKTKDFVRYVDSLEGMKKVLIVDRRDQVNPVLQLASGNLHNVSRLPWQVRGVLEGWVAAHYGISLKPLAKGKVQQNSYASRMAEFHAQPRCVQVGER